MKAFYRTFSGGQRPSGTGPGRSHEQKAGSSPSEIFGWRRLVGWSNGLLCRNVEETARHGSLAE